MRACYDPVMGLTYVEGKVQGRGRRWRRVRLLLDSGAVYSVLRNAEWRSLGLKPEREIEFVLADGTTITRVVSECTFEIEGRRATSPVVLGQSEDEALLGAVTLETLGLVLNPLNRTLQPMRMVLARTAAIEPRPKSQARPCSSPPGSEEEQTADNARAPLTARRATSAGSSPGPRVRTGYRPGQTPTGGRRDACEARESCSSN